MTDVEHPVEFEASSGNVFADLGLDNADEFFTRAQLGVQVFKLIKDGGYSQREAAQLLGVKQPEVSALMCGKFNRFSQERLIGFLNRLDPVRTAILLVAGDKAGVNEKRFYKMLIKKADERFEQHLKSL